MSTQQQPDASQAIIDALCDADAARTNDDVICLRPVVTIESMQKLAGMTQGTEPQS